MRIEQLKNKIENIISLEEFKKLVPKLKDAENWYKNLCKWLPEFNIDTKERVTAFLSQCIHESAGFTRLSENLNYSAIGLMKTWPSRFPTKEVALQYERNPAKIANKVYGGRMGNAHESSGDGWRYRGRGIIQLTGKDNYMVCSNDLFRSNKLVDNPDLLLDPYYAILSACWYWNKNSLNFYADKRDIKGLTRGINGGLNGLEDRVFKYNSILAMLDNDKSNIG